MTNPLVDKAADAFAATLVECRAERGLSKKQLAAEMGFDPSYVSHVENRRHRPTEDFARRAENVLRAGGAIWDSYAAYDHFYTIRQPQKHPVRDNTNANLLAWLLGEGPWPVSLPPPPSKGNGS